MRIINVRLLGAVISALAALAPHAARAQEASPESKPVEVAAATLAPDPETMRTVRICADLGGKNPFGTNAIEMCVENPPKRMTVDEAAAYIARHLDDPQYVAEVCEVVVRATEARRHCDVYRLAPR